MVPLSRAEAQLSMSDSPFRQNKFIYWTEKVIMLVVKGYFNTGKKSKFDIGPIDTFVSYNGAEGWRFMVGGMTTANLCDRFFARGRTGVPQPQILRDECFPPGLIRYHIPDRLSILCRLSPGQTLDQQHLCTLAGL